MSAESASRAGAGLGVRDRLVLAGLLCAAAAIRAFAWSRTAVIFNDGPIFLAMAEALRDGRSEQVLAHPQHPLYPALVALLESLALAPETAAVAVSIGGGLLAVAAVHRIAYGRFGSAVGAAAGAIAALHPWAVDFSADVMSDGLYGGLFLAGLACLIELLERPSALRAGLFGSFAGLAYWTRPEGLILVVVAAGATAFRFARQTGPRRASWRFASGAIAASLLFVGALRLAEGTDGAGFALSQKKSVAVLLEGGPSAEALAADRALRREARRDPEALPLPEASIRIDGGAQARPARSLPGAVQAAVGVVATSLSA
ncbi:glycosyltransferase family 39 protein, partial [Myxococcota bacterium]|nr:glycosyltransferase family 39 protein [Myxococcota bacterium]